jgi:hypothetical protein
MHDTLQITGNFNKLTIFQEQVISDSKDKILVLKERGAVTYIMTTDDF